MSLELRLNHQPASSWDDVRTDADERAWVGRIRAGDIDAFEGLYRAYWERLYAFAFRYMRSKEDAEEVVQEVFFRIWRGRANWVPAGAVRNYLYLAVRNSARDRLERAAVARRWRIGQRAQHATDTAIQSDLEARDLVAAVGRALSELPDKRSAVCKLRLIDELSYAQIAERLGISEKTVETQLARGLKFLRDRIRPHPGLAPGVRTSAPADGSAANMYRPTSAAAPRGA
jgi:RNA polymerase sigma-70 factor (ECF subfamily)